MKKHSIEEMKKLARLKHGNCLSEKYIDCKTHLTWQCDKGHIWTARPDNIKSGKWCPRCAIKRRSDGNIKYGISDADKIAQERGGKCLSKSYIGIKDKLLWRCVNGHEWHASFANVKNKKSWCPYCTKFYTEQKCRYIIERLSGLSFPKSRSVLDNGLELDGYNSANNIAFEYNGEQHYRYVKMFHRFPEGFEKQKKRDQDKINLCLSKHVNLMTIPYWAATNDKKLIQYIRPKIESIWNLSLTNTDVNMNSFYRECQSLKDLQNIASKKGGEILTKEYHGSYGKMECKCKKGHIWETDVTNIKSGRWCPYCAKNVKYSIDYMQKIAENKGGKCLSTKYLNANSKLRWQCKYGHEWKTIPSVRMNNRKSWGPVCYGHQRKTIKDMHLLADKKNGKCISTEYRGSHNKLTWQCHKGHTWEAKPNKISTGQWCPKCARTKKAIGGV